MKKTAYILLAFLGLSSLSQANLEVVKGIKNNLTTVQTGQTFTYTLQYRAASTTTDFFGATLVDQLPEGIQFQSLVGTVHVNSFNYDAGSRTLTVNFIDPLPAGSTGEIEVNVRFAPGTTPNGTVAINTAVMDATNAAPYTSNPVPITALASSQTTLSKSLLGSGIPLDQNVTYQVSLNNNPQNGNLNISDITLIDSLPAGSLFVAASHGGVYDPISHTVTWTAGSLSAGSNLNRTLTLQFPAATFSLGDTIVNEVSASYTPVGLPEANLNASTSHKIVAPVGSSQFSKSVDSNYVYEDKPTNKSWNFTLRNTGNVPMHDVVVTDPIPSQVNVTSFTTGNGVGTPSGLADPVLVFYTTNLNPAWTGAPGNPYNGNSNHTIFVSTLGLAANEYITEVRWEFGTIPVGYQVNNLRITTGILTVDRDGNPVEAGDNIVNTAALDYSDFTGPQVKSNTATIPVKTQRPVARLEKSASPSTVDDGDTTTFTVRLINRHEAAEAMINPVLADLLDEKLVYVPDSWVVTQKPAGAPDPVFELIENYNGSGRTLLRWSWTGASAYALPIDSRVEIKFDAEIPRGTIYGNIRNDIHLVSWDNDALDVHGTSNRKDTLNLSGSGDTDKTIYFQGTNVTVRGRASMDSVKWVKGELDSDWSKYPESGETVPGGRADYRLIIENTGNVPIRDAAILDILPTLDDNGVIDLSQRDTEWRASLAGPVVAPPGVTVYYSRSQNPIRTDFVSSGPAGAEDPEWSITPPATIIEARSLLFVFDDVIINPGESFELSWPMRAPVATPTDGRIAWNSFGYLGTRVDTNGRLLASEPIKVGIKVKPDDNASYGDRVWLDLNFDGIQDAGEPGLNGIKVHLYEDSGPGGFPDGIRDTSVDRYVGFTVTADNFFGEPGYYLFPNLDRGYYYAVFEIPDGYVVSPDKQGGDPALDSNVAFGDIWLDGDGNRFGMTEIVWLPQEGKDLTWDLGLWLPPTGVEIVKTAGSAADGEDYWSISGQPVTYTYVVTNTGDIPLVRLRVDDDKLGIVAKIDGPLLPGDSVTVTKTSAPLTAGVTNIGTVVGHPADPSGSEIPGAPLVTADDPAVVRIYAALGDFVWHDLNRNGIQDGGESGVAGTVVTLYDELGNAIDSQTTGANGKYLFNTLLPGIYSVGFEPPAGYILTLQNQGSDSAKDSDADRGTGMTGSITLVEGQVDLTWDAGLFKYSSLGDFVWIDEDADGLQGAAEVGLNGVTVNLFNADGTPAEDAYGNAMTTVTANHPDTGAPGYYIFDKLIPGSYKVQFIEPAGYLYTEQNADGAGINGAINSDASETDGMTDLVTLAPGEHNPRIDAGFIPSNPEIALTKLADKAVYSVDGEIITYTFVVENTGNVPLVDVMVTDPLFAVVGGPISLAVGEVDNSTFSGTYAVTLADLNAGQLPNTAKVEGIYTRTGEVVEDTDTVIVNAIQTPGIALTKTGTYRSGDCPDADTLGLGVHFNALIFGNLEAQGGDTDARLAVAGNATIVGGYSVGTVIKGDPLPTFFGSDTDIFIVGGDLEDGTFGVNGNIVFGGTRSGPVRYMQNGNITRQVNPITFDANGNVPNDGSGVTFAELLADMQARSALFGALEDRGVVVKDATLGYVVELVGEDPILNVFNLTAEEWSVSSASINITAPATSTVLVNIHGDSVAIHNAGMQLSGVNERRILYNYVNATSLTTSGFAQLGSVLAPYANGHFTGGSIDGRAILGGDVFTTGGFEFHNFPFEGSICLVVDYTFTVTNTGNITLTNITIDDPYVDEVLGGPISLNPGETDTDTFTATHRLKPSDLVNGEFVNNATVSGSGPQSQPANGNTSHTLTFTIPGLGAGAPGAGAGPGAGGSGAPTEVVLPDPSEDWKRADFVVKSITLDPAPQVTGQNFTAKVTVTNEGHIGGNAGILRVWGDKPESVETGDAGGQSFNVGVLNPGDTKTYTVSLTAPADAGTYFVRAYIDIDGVTEEYSEGNNQLPHAYTVFGPASSSLPDWMKPDFVVQSIELVPSPTVTGARFEAIIRVTNIGDIPGDGGNLAFWSQSPSWSNLPAAPDVVVPVGVIAVGEVAEFTVSDLQAPIHQGTYFARAVVNVDETTDEKSFGNNHGGATYTVHPVVLKIESEPGVQNTLTWNSAPGYIYFVERSTDLVNYTEISGNIGATPPVNSFVDDSLPAGSVFYRVWGFKP